MGLFDGYTQLSNESGNAFMSVSASGITFSKAVVTKLMAPRYVSFWINSEKKMIIITPTDEADNAHSFRFARKDDSTDGVLMHRRNLQRKIYEIMGYEYGTIQDTIYVDGEFYPSENAFQFDTKKGYVR